MASFPRLACSLVALAVLCAAAPARADAPCDEGASGEEATTGEQAAAPSAADEDAEPCPSPRRPIPDYDGRRIGPTPGDRALWIPRVVFFPIWWVAEVLVRRPLVWLTGLLAERQLVRRYKEFFTFGPEDRVTLMPTFLYDLGFRPNAGLRFEYREIRGSPATVFARVAYGGADWLSGEAGLRVTRGVWRWDLRGGGQRRPDGRFFGLGSEARDGSSARFRWDGVDVTSRLGWHPTRGDAITLALGVRRRRFRPAENPQRSIEAVVEDPETSVTALPPAYPDGYDALRLELGGELDTRPYRPHPLTGVRAAASVLVGADVRERERRGAWLRWQGELTGHWDVSGARHVLRLGLHLTGTEIVSGAMPFTELPDLGGSGPMRGFHGGRLVGRSGAALLLAYDWPIWQAMDGTLQLGLGNVYDGHFQELGPGNSRLSVAFGFAAIGKREHRFQMLVGFGTEPFDEGGQVKSVRFTVGVAP